MLSFGETKIEYYLVYFYTVKMKANNNTWQIKSATDVYATEIIMTSELKNNIIVCKFV